LPVFERHDLVRLGSDYGEWWMSEQAISIGDCSYCAGVGNDVNFEVVLDHPGTPPPSCSVVPSPTPRQE
jgi:hypothetical protein